jgi:hypothetical protein
MVKVIPCEKSSEWRAALAVHDKVDVCHMPEYHSAYQTRFPGARAMLWTYSKHDYQLSYPFLLSPVILKNQKGESEETGYFDVSGVYGFSGPLSTTADRSFLDDAWKAFDQWAQEQKAICEFIRFSVYAKNHTLASPVVIVEPNRPISIALLPSSSEELLEQLPSKTRNMIRRANKEGLVAREINVRDGLRDFRELYEGTMARNQATRFFAYDDTYYEKLLSLPKEELVLHAVYQNEKMVAAAMGLIHKEFAFYHLGASSQEASKIGAGNLALYDLACGAIKRGVNFLSVGGGRTTSPEDPLFRFKASNGTSVEQYYIGKRVLDPQSYDKVARMWKELTHEEANSNQIQFYR